MFLILACLPGIISSLGAVTVTIGSGTASNQYLPIRAESNYTFSQQIYTQAQINTVGGDRTAQLLQSDLRHPGQQQQLDDLPGLHIQGFICLHHGLGASSRIDIGFQRNRLNTHGHRLDADNPAKPVPL